MKWDFHLTVYSFFMLRQGGWARPVEWKRAWRNMLTIIGSGADCLGSQNGASSGADCVGSRNGAGSGAASVGSLEQSGLWSGLCGLTEWSKLWSGLCGLMEQSGLWSGLCGLTERSGLWSGLCGLTGLPPVPSQSRKAGYCILVGHPRGCCPSNRHQRRVLHAAP